MEFHVNIELIIFEKSFNNNDFDYYFVKFVDYVYSI